MIKKVLFTTLAFACLLFSETVTDSLFFEAAKTLDFNSLDGYELSSEQEDFLRGLEYIRDGEYDASLQLFKELNLDSKDSMMVENSKQLLGSIYLRTSQWDSLAEMNVPNDEHDFFSLIEGFRSAPKEHWIFPEEDQVLPISLSISGTPIVEVEIAGRKHKFWLDTGAGISVLSSDVAAECGITPLSADESQALTSTTKKVGIQPAIIPDLKISGIHVENHPAVIIDSENLKFRFLGITFLKIDGIIGWNAIQNMDLEIDYDKKSLIIRRPVRSNRISRNLFWLDFPIAVLTLGGEPLYFFLDTGANKTGIFERVLAKLSSPKVRKSTSYVSGAGGMERFEVKKIPKLELTLGDHPLVFKNVSTLHEHEVGFIRLDGILGGDALREHRVRIDITNGIFEIY